MRRLSIWFFATSVALSGLCLSAACALALWRTPQAQSLSFALPVAATNTSTATATRIAATTPTQTGTPTPRPTRTPTATPTRPRPTVTPVNTATPTATFPPAVPTVTPTATPVPSPTQTPLPSGPSDLQTIDVPSAALVGNLNPSQKLPSEIEDCHWAQQNGARVACKVQIFLPPGYHESNRRYPVLFLLHGWGGWDTQASNSEWNWFGMFSLADDMMRAGEIPPFIIVVPEGDHAYWFNHAGDNERWGDYVAVELVTFMDANYRTIARRDSRAIGGLSMGGLGAIQLALNRPDLFAAVGMRSPTLRRIGDPDVPPFFGDANYYARYDPLLLADVTNNAQQLAIYIIIGEQDEWLGRTQEFRAILDRKAVTYEWHLYPGAHDPEFYGSRLDEDLLFYGTHLAINP